MRFTVVAGEGRPGRRRLWYIVERMVGPMPQPMRRGAALLALAAGLVTWATAGLAAPAIPAARPAGAAARLGFHLARAAALREALAPVVYGPCPRFSTRAAWDAYLAGLVEEGVTFAAHLDEAWREAKASGDEQLRTRVKTARREMLVGNPVQLVGKLTSCAWRNGSSVDAWGLWRRASEEVRVRRQEVAREAAAATGSPATSDLSH